MTITKEITINYMYNKNDNRLYTACWCMHVCVCADYVSWRLTCDMSAPSHTLAHQPALHSLAASVLSHCKQS